MPLQPWMNRNPSEPRNAIGVWHDDDDACWTAPDLSEDSAAAAQLGSQRLRSLLISIRGRINRGPRTESAVDDLNHRGRILRRRDGNHKIRNRDAH
jgi:hypothetical protein